MSKAKLHVGTIDDMGSRFIDAWDRAKTGERVEETHFTFETWGAMNKALSEKRIELLQHLFSQPEKSIRSLSKHIGRDYSRVHADVKILRQVGLISQEGLRVECDSIQTDIRIKPATAIGHS